MRKRLNNPCTTLIAIDNPEMDDVFIKIMEPNKNNCTRNKVKVRKAITPTIEIIAIRKINV